MAYNGSGTFQRLYNWVTDRAGGIKIRADRMDAEFDGVATGLSNVICKDGQTTITADIPFNNHKITGLGDATSGTHALNRQAGDARYMQRPAALTPLTDLADTDIFGAYDASSGFDSGVTWANVKANVLAEMTTSFFPAGTRILFQGAPPTGWTLETGAAYNDAALKFTTGTPATGGSVAFSTLFASQTLTGTVGSSALSIANLAVHDHSDSSAAGSVTVAAGSDVTIKPNTGTTGSAGSSTGHNHSLTMNAFNMAVKYASVNIGQKS